MNSLTLGSASTETEIVRLVQMLYGSKLGEDTMDAAVATTTQLSLPDLMNALYLRDLAAVSTTQLATLVVKNLGITGTAAVAEAEAYVATALGGAAAAARGAVLLQLVDLFSSLTDHAVYGAAATKFNADVAAALTYANTDGTADVQLAGGQFNPMLAPWLHPAPTPAPPAPAPSPSPTPSPSPSPTPAPSPAPEPPPPPPPAPAPSPIVKLDVVALSNNIAASIGDNPLADEGLYITLTLNPSNVYKVDADNNGVLSPAETTTTTMTLGVDNVYTGNSNDRLVIGSTEVLTGNEFDLGGQQDNNTPGALLEGGDSVTYKHGDLTNDGLSTAEDVPRRPTLVVSPDAQGVVRVVQSAGALEAETVTDVLRNVERLDIVDAATSDRHDDRFDLSGMAGATLNYGSAVTVGASAGGVGVPMTAAQLDAASLDAGGIAASPAALGKETITVAGATLVERVTGSAGNDRVIVAAQGAMQALGTGAFTAKDSPRPTNADVVTTDADGLADDLANWADQRLYRFELAAGSEDALDYRQNTTRVTVSVDTSATGEDLVFVGTPGAGRVDSALGVEQFFGGSGGGAAQNWIDLAAATQATTLRFSALTDVAEPDGHNGGVSTGLAHAAQLSASADGSLLASFVDRTGAGLNPASRWLNVQGSAFAETVVFSDNETATAHNLQLQGGANRVDYAALTAPITAVLGATNLGTAVLQQAHVVNGDTILHNAAGDPAANRLTVVASARAGDQLNVAALANGAVLRADPALPTTSQVDPLFHVVDLSAGTVTESLYGEYLDGATLRDRAFVTNVAGFENATNAGDGDAVHLLGDNGRNALTGGTAADLIVGGRGTAGDGSADVGAGNRGDRLAGDAGADSFLYRSEAESPNGTIGAGDQNGALFNNDEDNVVNSRDTIADFAAGVDKLVFQVSDTADSVRGAGTVPANLGSALNAAVAMVNVFAAGSTQVRIGKDAASTGTVDDFDDYAIDNTGATLSVADLVLRVMATSGGDVIDASAGLAVGNLDTASADGLEVRLTYTAASQSQAGGFDQVLHFASGSDKIDLSFLKLARYESEKASTGVDYDTDHDNVVDALANPIRTLGAAPVFAVNGTAPNLFIDGTVYRPVATQTLNDGNGDPSTTVFIDANGDGNYVPTDDMVLVLVGVAAPAAGDFVFDLYGGGWGG